MYPVEFSGFAFCGTALKQVTSNKIETFFWIMICKLYVTQE